MPTIYDKYKEKLLNQKPIAVIVISFIVIAAVIPVAVGVIKLWDIVFPAGSEYQTETSTPIDPPVNDTLSVYQIHKVDRKPIHKSAKKVEQPNEESIPKTYANTIAILPFTVIAKSSEHDWLGKGIPEGLTAAISSADSLVFIEANLRETVLGEIDFEQSKYVDKNEAVQVGKLLGVKLIVTGSCQISAEGILITARVIEVEKGIVRKNCLLEQKGSVEKIFVAQAALAKQLRKCLE